MKLCIARSSEPQRAAALQIACVDHSHALIRSIDCAKARAAPGVVAVFTADELADVAPVFATSRMKNYHATAITALASGKVRYVGEPVVAIVAQSRYLAEDALELIEIDFEPLPVVIDPEEAVKADAPLLHDAAGTNVLLEREFKRGDVDKAMKDAALTVRGRFRMHRKSPMAMEPRCYFADYDEGRECLMLHSATQVPGIIRDALSDALGMPGGQIRVVAAEVGGGFGGKASLYPEELFVAFAARHLAKPVKWTSDRMEDLVSTSQSFDEIVEAELAFDADGTHTRSASRSDRRCRRLLDLSVDRRARAGAGGEFLPGPYRIEHYRGRTRGVATSKPPTGPYRGVGRPISTFVMERLMDMAARRLKIDPKELRLKNLVQRDEFPYRTGSGIVWDQCAFGVPERGLRTAGYASLRKRQAKARAAGRWFGIGLACYAELTGIGSRISAAPGMPINTGQRRQKL